MGEGVILLIEEPPEIIRVGDIITDGKIRYRVKEFKFPIKPIEELFFGVLVNEIE